MKGRVFSVLLALIFGIVGCAMLQEAPLVEIPASRLTCDQNPEMVDGNLKTVGIFATQGSIKKEFVTIKLRKVYQPKQYQRRVEGSLKTETLIKLDTPNYIKYVEVYPASTIRNLTLDVGIERPNRKLSFEAVEDKRSIDVEGTLPVRFQIGREILYLRLTANALEDLDNVSDGDEYGEMQIPLKGAAIREVKFYGR
ncbi:hypothetical protein F4Z99_06770, partial [Candidatus Poribacteria bacterium]|nr:hypothetical protein [Candidatus Poribacteria bacterium]